ncbi:MAG: hypothetical protein ACTSVI_08855 [Promethearchaeota archaeon]
MLKENSSVLLFARKVSNIGNAITFSLLIGILFSFFTPQVIPSWIVFLLTFITMIFAPGFFLLLAMKLKGIDFDFSEKDSRTPYYLIVECCYIAGLFIFSPLLLTSWPIFNLALVSTLLNGLLTIINLKWKISAHAAGSAGPATGMAIVISPWILLVMIPAVFLVCWSRLVLKKHTALQLVFGTLLSIFSYMFVFMMIYPLNLF